MKNLTINCNNIQISNDKQICLIAGPCQLETEQHALDMAGKIGEIAKKYNLGFVYKTSFDKANRTSLKGKRGAGLENSLPIFETLVYKRRCFFVRSYNPNPSKLALCYFFFFITKFLVCKSGVCIKG